MSELTRELSELAGSWIVKEAVVVATSSPPAVLVAAADPLRWALAFGIGLGTVGSGVAISTLASLNSTTGGMQITAQSGPLLMSYRQFGALVQQAWYGIGAGGNANLTVIQVRGQQ